MATIDVTQTAIDAGFRRVRVLVTEEVNRILTPRHNDACQDYLIRLWELLERLRLAQAKQGTETLTFSVLIRRGHAPPRPVGFRAVRQNGEIAVSLAREVRP